MIRKSVRATVILAALLLTPLALAATTGISEQAKMVVQQSFRAKGQAGMDRLVQDDVQRTCSRTPKQAPLSAKEIEGLMRSQEAAIRYPADGNYVGDWREGEKIAQSGIGMQFSDDPTKPAGGNCYACHQLSKTEISYGTIGPSLYQYRALRGDDPDLARRTYAKIYNPQAFLPCSKMPRFGHKGILTEAQIKDVVALLLAPASPVNQE
jgi:sulfur-oxidizing protein SoxX